jgi:hypothetical protein
MKIELVFDRDFVTNDGSYSCLRKLYIHLDQSLAYRGYTCIVNEDKQEDHPLYKSIIRYGCSFRELSSRKRKKLKQNLTQFTIN